MSSTVPEKPHSSEQRHPYYHRPSRVGIRNSPGSRPSACAAETSNVQLLCVCREKGACSLTRSPAAAWWSADARGDWRHCWPRGGFCATTAPHWPSSHLCSAFPGLPSSGATRWGRGTTKHALLGGWGGSIRKKCVPALHSSWPCPAMSEILTSVERSPRAILSTPGTASHANGYSE